MEGRKRRGEFRAFLHVTSWWPNLVRLAGFWMVAEERLPEACAEVSDGDWHAQPDPENHESQGREVKRHDDRANDFQGHDVEEMCGGMGGLLAAEAV